MMVDQRKEKLLHKLAEEKKMSLREAMDILGVSESTARRTFLSLEESGKAVRVLGGIRYVFPTMTSYDFEAGAYEMVSEKKAIAREAVKFVEDGDVIFCDSGTTIRCMCVELAEKIRREKLRVRIYTNSLANLEILSGVTEVTLVGGRFRQNRRDFCGYLAEEVVTRLHFSKVFVGADGCSGERVFTTTDMETARLNQIVLENTDYAFMLTDSSKFYTVSHILYAPAKQFTAVITDRGIDPDVLTRLKAQCRKVICAGIGEKSVIG